MTSFWFFLLLLIMASPLLPLANSQLSSDTSTISASPAFLTNSSPYQELSPEIAPLLPSPGGVLPTTGSSISTIPSSPSPPNPDQFDAIGPDSASSPFGSLPYSLSVPRNVVGLNNLAIFAGWVAYWSLQLLIRI